LTFIATTNTGVPRSSRTLRRAGIHTVSTISSGFWVAQRFTAAITALFQIGFSPEGVRGSHGRVDRQCIPCQLDKIRPQNPPVNGKRSNLQPVSPFFRTRRCKHLILRREPKFAPNSSLLIIKSEDRHNQSVNVQPAKNPQFHSFHAGPQINFIFGSSDSHFLRPTRSVARQ
jgi:hypothetical protein